MSLELRQGLRQEQRLALLPQMLQSIEVLQLATADLVQLLEKELQENETLELRAAAATVPDVPERRERDDADQEPWRRGVADGDDNKQGFLDNVPARQGSLVDHVREQLAFRRVPALLVDAIVRLVEHLDERGLLPVALDDLATSLDVPPELLREAHAVLCTLEPRGIGACDAIEAMLLQAEGDPDLPVIERMLRQHLDDLGKNRLPDVAHALELSIDELQQLMQRVATLNPRPAAAFHEADGMAVRPDAYAWLHNGALQAALDDEALPDLFVNEQYAALAGDRRTEREVRDYLRPKLRSARDLIEAVAQRKATLLRVVKAVMQEQLAFLARGRTALRPLRMSEIADRLDLHTSTISRTIAGKYVQTDRGVFALRDFFDGGRIDAAPAEGQGRMAVAEQITELVAAEDKLRPLSDDELVTALAGRGVQVARRTVAKYRGELGIPSSYLRRRFRDPS